MKLKTKPQVLAETISQGHVLSRRSFLTYSGIAIGGVTLSSYAAKVDPNLSSNDEKLLPSITQQVTPDADNPVRVNFNENAIGMSPQAKKAAIAAVDKANRYAKKEMPQLNLAIANHHQVTPDYVLLTAGSSEGILSSINAWSSPTAQLVIPELTYGDGEAFAKIFNLKITKVPSLKDWAFDIEGMDKAVNDYDGDSIVYLVNPNNPTSTIMPTEKMMKWIRSKPKNTIFVVDEAYGEFVNDPTYQSVDGLIREGLDNVLLLKTFSKIHGMAGLRVGYVLTNPANIKRVSQYVAGEKLNYCGVCAALASMQDPKYLAYSKQAIDTSRKIMEQVFTELDIYFLPSQTNFMFHKISIDLAKYQKLMLDNHIIVGRAFPPADDWSRISLGTPGEMLYTASVLRKLRAQNMI